MRFVSIFYSLVFLSLFLCGHAFAVSRSTVLKADSDDTIVVSLGGNAWRTDKDTTGGDISNTGIVNWSDKNAVFTVYVRFARKCSVRLWLKLTVPAGVSTISVGALKQTQNIQVKANSGWECYAGNWNVADTGYVAFRIKGVNKTGDIFANVEALVLQGPQLAGQTAYVKNNDGDFFYWGRRGPSVHLGYPQPPGEDVQWFYNEVTVPKGNDVLGSYFMACGFGEGYFGMQVNSPTVRHVLFSVWSPFTTDDPKKIPEEEKIRLLKKGDGVHAGEFGSEGSGGQSYLNYPWKAGRTYKFLVSARPDGNGRTVYTAWFLAPEEGRWRLIASFSRPKTTTYLRHLYSFLENFDPLQGTITRKVYFGNGWIAGKDGHWTELTQARFTIDNTGAKGYRMDYAGGLDGKLFYLKNCGFFAKYTTRNIMLNRQPSGKAPDVDLDALP